MTRALLLLLVAFILAAFLRFPDRAAKPMHVDEATQAVKLGELMDGKYIYDPVDHHGPTLLYATLPVKWFSSAQTWSDLTESQLRLVPVLFGMGLLLLLLLVGDGLTPSELAWGAVAVAVSPLMVFYSRYYIMEMLMVFFSFAMIGCGWRFYLTRQSGWMVGAGVCAGLMHATKETCVLQFAAIAVALGLVWMVDLFSAGSGLGVVNRGRKNPIRKAQFLTFVAAAVMTSVLIFSKFFTAPASVVASVTTYGKMFSRAGGQGHEKPFFYYRDLIWGGAMSAGPVRKVEERSTIEGESKPPELDSSNPFSRLFWKYLPERMGLKPTGRIVWGERLCLFLALIGMVAAFTTKPSRNQSRHLVRFLAVYSVVLFLIYSAVSYKTPWLVLGPWHGMLILAGVGAAALLRFFEGRVGRSVVGILLVAGFLHAALLAYRATRSAPSFAAHGRNPLNYSMTSADCLDWVEKIYRFAEVSGKGNQLAIVQADAGGGWPLPWYLSRKFPQYVWQGGDFSLMEKADVILSGLDFRASLPQSVLGLQGAPAVPAETADGKTPDGKSGDGKPGDGETPADGETPEETPGETADESPGVAAKPPEWVEFGITLHPSGRLAVFVRRSIWEAYVAEAAKAPWPPLQVQH